MVLYKQHQQAWTLRNELKKNGLTINPLHDLTSQSDSIYPQGIK